MDIMRHLRNRVGVSRRRRATILLHSRAINNSMVHLHPSKARVSGEHHLLAGSRVMEHPRRISMAHLHPSRVAIHSRRLASTAPLRPKAGMDSRRSSNTALLHHSNTDMVPLHPISTVLLLVSSTVLLKASARPLSHR